MKYSIFIVIIGFFCSQIAFSQWREEHPNSQKLGEVYNYIDQMYVDDVDYEGVSDAAIRAMLEELDPHSTYIPKKDVQDANEAINGSFVGVGIRFQILKDTLIVINCIEGGPSSKVGVLPGDKIIKIEDELVAGVGLKNSGVRERLLGEKDTKVKVSILRGKVSSKLLDFIITRDKIPVHSVASAYMIDDNIGYIKLTRFSKTSADEVREALRDLKSNGMKDLILDLQGNRGGLLYGAKYIADEFLKDNKLIVYSEGKRQPRSNLLADTKGNFESGRLVVLIDEGSASASEIVAGAIQDWDRGVVVGRRSYGKGLVQRPIDLNDGSQIRLTIARYFTPSGRFIQRPYDDLEAYRQDRYDRFMNGEMTNRDSIKLPDSLQFKTMINKRIVYGGGGIMPDEFVALDTTEYSDFYKKLSRKGVINTFTVNYANDNRKKIINEYTDLKGFIEAFQTDEAFMDEFFNYAEVEDSSLVFVADDYEVSKELIQMRLKAMLAQNIWDYTAFYQIINKKNEIFVRGYEILTQGRYENLNLTVN